MSSSQSRKQTLDSDAKAAPRKISHESDSWITSSQHSPKSKVLEQAKQFGGAVGDSSASAHPVGKIFDIDKPIQSAKTWQKHIKHEPEVVVTDTKNKKK
jgi:hypothetical protein